MSEQDNNRGEACIMSAGGSLRDRVLRPEEQNRTMLHSGLCGYPDCARLHIDSRLQLGFVPGDGIKRDPDKD